MMIRSDKVLWSHANVELRTPSVADVAYVCRHMRDQDKAEVFAGRYDDDPIALAFDYECLRPGAVGFYAAFASGLTRPIALFGAWENHPGAGVVHLIATDKWRKVAGPVTRFFKQVMIQSLIDAGWRRGECRALASNYQCRNWLYYLGAREEVVLFRYGKNDEDFVQLAWSAPHVHG